MGTGDKSFTCRVTRPLFILALVWEYQALSSFSKLFWEKHLHWSKHCAIFLLLLWSQQGLEHSLYLEIFFIPEEMILDYIFIYVEEDLLQENILFRNSKNHKNHHHFSNTEYYWLDSFAFIVGSHLCLHCLKTGWSIEQHIWKKSTKSSIFNLWFCFCC